MNRLYELRIANNMSMRQAAEALGLPYTTYVNYEKNAREPNSETLIRIAEYYGVSTDYIIGRTLDKAISSDLPDSGKRVVSDDEMMFALWGDAENVDKGDLDDVKRYAAFIQERKKKK